MTRPTQASPTQSSDTPVRVEVFAEYQLFSSYDGKEWWGFIQDEIESKNSIVAHGELIYYTAGRFGLQYLYFLTEFYVASVSDKEVKKACRRHLNTLVGDTDVIVHNVTPSLKD